MTGLTGMILDIHFVDAETGFIAGASEAAEDKAHARILKTTDGGRSWRAVFDSDRAGDVNWKLAFPSAKVGYTVTRESRYIAARCPEPITHPLSKAEARRIWLRAQRLDTRPRLARGRRRRPRPSNISAMCRSTPST